MSTTGNVAEIDCGENIGRIAFLPDAAHILAARGLGMSVQRRRRSDGRRVGAEMEPGPWHMFGSIAVSNDGQWIATAMRDHGQTYGTEYGRATVWDALTHDKFMEIRQPGRGRYVKRVDFSPDSTMLMALSSDTAGTTTLWDIKTGRQIATLERNEDGYETVTDIRFSPDGARIACIHSSHNNPRVVRIFDSGDGSCVREINTGRSVSTLAWSRDSKRLFAGKDGNIICFDAVTGSVLSQLWGAHNDSDHDMPSIATRQSLVKTAISLTLPDASMFLAVARQGFIVSGTEHSVSFLDASTLTPIGSVLKPARSIVDPSELLALSPDGLNLAISGEPSKHKVTIYPLKQIIPQSYFADSEGTDAQAQNVAGENVPPRVEQNATVASSPTATTLQLPLLRVSPAVFASWIQDDLPETKAALTREMMDSSPSSPIDFALASRALVHSRMQEWQAAQDDAKKSLDSQYSVPGLIAKSVALVGLKKYKRAFRTFDLALADARCDVNERNLLMLIKSILSWMAGDYDDAVARATDSMDMVKDVSVCLLVQAQMYLDLGRGYKEQGDHTRAIQSFELARVPATFQPTPEVQVISLIFGWRFEGLQSAIQQQLRETLLDVQSKRDTVRSLLLEDTLPEDLWRTANRATWIDAFVAHRVVVLEQIGDKSVENDDREEALSRYMAALSLSPNKNNSLLTKWAKLKLTRGSWKSALSASTKFQVTRFDVYREICDALESAGQWLEAFECFHKMEGEIKGVEVNQWHHVFERWLRRKLWRRAFAATPAPSHDETIQLCSAALFLHPSNRKDILVKRGNTLALAEKWDDALRDADEVIALNPLSHLGFRMRHVALLATKHYDEALEAHKMMLSKLPNSRDAAMDELYDQYVSPLDVEAAIHEAVERAARDLPRILIDTTTGRIRNKSEQISAFFVTTTFKELRASMTTKIDQTRIEDAVKIFYRYVMFSHTWEGQEPTFQLVERISVYELQKTPQNEKLIEFCLIVLATGFVWAWSDTCCIDQKDQVVLQESLVSMFRWYLCSAWTIVFLRGDGTLETSRWITRVWTNQEYVAAKKIWFYTGTTAKWTPYLGLPATINSNHKDDPRIREAMVSSVKEIAAREPFADGLQPGLDYIREKLCVAATRNTTLPEDFAYSLLGIFGVSIPVIYGEGESAALGRLLGHILTASGDASILAWRGESGTFHSCFPAHITVFQTLATTHLPAPLSDVEIDSNVQSLTPSITALAISLYDQLIQLPVPSFSANRMRLPCIMFPLGPIAAIQGQSGRLYRAKTAALGEVDVPTKAQLHHLGGALYLIHPWLHSLLLDREASQSPAALEDVLDLPAPRQGEVLLTDPDRTNSVREPDCENSTCKPDSEDQLHPSLSTPSPTPRAPVLDAPTRALRLVARLRQPFGALLLTLTDRGYQRVAADAIITVRLKEDVNLNSLIDNIRTIDVL